MKKAFLGAFCAAGFALATFLSTSRASAQTEPNVSIALKNDVALTPVEICSNGESRATKTLEFYAPVAPDVAIATVSEPKFVSRIEARVGDAVVGYFDANGIFDADWNRPTKATQIPIQIDDRSRLANGGEISIWVVPSGLADPGTSVEIGLKCIKAGSRTIDCSSPPIAYRFGTLVRDSGWDGVARYRIPAIVRTSAGVLVAAYDARWNGFSDLPANIDVMCSRSFDDGNTWEKPTILMDFQGANPEKEGVGDPALLFDRETGRIWAAAIWGRDGLGVWNAKPGLKPGTSPRFVLSYSDDDGATWSEPRDVTNEVAPDKNWRFIFQGPGVGIALRDGKLVFPVQYSDENGTWFSTIVWSGDKGQSWNVGTGARSNVCEDQVVELNDGSLMLNMRNFTEKFRSVAVTKDLGKTWTEHPTSGSVLVEPVCQASLIRVKSTVDGDASDILAFMNPKSPTSRTNLTLRLSEDEGLSWSRELTLYRAPSLGYSSLTRLDGDAIGVLYETVGGLMFQRVKLAEIPKVE